MTCSDRYDLQITYGDDSHGLLCDWTKGGAGLSIKKASTLQSTAVSTKGSYGVRDVDDYFRIVQTDWCQGQGQTTYDREQDSESAFEDSRSIDISHVGELRLGPKVAVHASAEVTGPLIAHGHYSGSPMVWAALSHDTPSWMVARSGDGESWSQLSSGAPDGMPVSFASDGENLWLATVTGHVYVVVPGATCSQFASGEAGTHGITHLAWTGGYLYGAKGVAGDISSAGTDATVGVWLSGVWTAITPEDQTAINAEGTTFGMVSSGTYVYWGLTSAMKTTVYKVRWSATAEGKILQAVATFPTGFVGASMFSYLGTIYVGGHWDGASPQTGVGAIYAIVEDQPALLTDVGSDKSLDNRVLAMTAYERSLYFVSNSQVWKWDLVHGGYSHFMGPLDITAVTPYAYQTLSWTAYDFSSSPTGTVDYGSTSGLSYGQSRNGASCVLMAPAPAPGGNISSYVPVPALSNAGWTVELDLPADAVQSVGNATTSFSGISVHDGTRAPGLHILRPNGTSGPYWVYLMDSDIYRGGNQIDASSALTLRLVVVGNSAKVYANGVLIIDRTIIVGAPSRPGVPSKLISWEAQCLGTSHAGYFDRIRYATEPYTESLAFAPVTGVGLAAFRDKVIAACSGYGFVYCDPSQYATTPTEGRSPYLRSSRSSGNMPTVEKYFKEIDITLLHPLPTGTTVTVAGTIDSISFGPVAAEDSAARMLVFPVGIKGRVIQYDLIIDASSATVTPVIAEASVVFEPVQKRPSTYTYFLRCWRDAEDRSGFDWDEDAPTVADWLEEIAGEVVTVERAGRDSYNGRIESLEYLEAPPSGKANGREGLYQMTVKVVS